MTLDGRAGERVLVSITRFLARTLRLTVNHPKSAVARSGERTFLGYRIRGRAQARRGIAPESVKRAKDTIRRITRRTRGVSLDCVLREVRTFTDGRVAYFWAARMPSVFQALDKWVRRRLRCYQWKQGKTPRRCSREPRRAGAGNGSTSPMFSS